MAASLEESDNLWRECAQWLTRCKVIPMDHRINRNETELLTLARTLRDGVLLCSLLIHLDKNSMDTRETEIHKKPQGAQVKELFCYQIPNVIYLLSLSIKLKFYFVV